MVSTKEFQVGNWKLIERLLQRDGGRALLEHQLTSFDTFLRVQLEEIVQQFNPIKLHYDYVSTQTFYKNQLGEWVEFFNDEHLKKLVMDELISESQIKNSGGDSTIRIDIVDKQMNIIDEEKVKLEKRLEEMIANLTFKSMKVHKYRYEVEIKMQNVRIQDPCIHETNGQTKPLYPSVARLRNFSYVSSHTMDVHFSTIHRSGENLETEVRSPQKVLSGITIGKLPIMVGSSACLLSRMRHVPAQNLGECPYDLGGYFIINGQEKVVISQEHVIENKALCFENHKVSNNRYSTICDIKSAPHKMMVTPKNIKVMILARTSNDCSEVIRVSLPHIRTDIPVVILFRLIGVISDKEIAEMVLCHVPPAHTKTIFSMLESSLDEANHIRTEEQAKLYMCRFVAMMGYDRDKTDREKRFTYLGDVMENDLLPHIRGPYRRKASYLGYMVYKALATHAGLIPYDDRDSYVNKKIDTPGMLLANLYRQYYTKMIKDMKTQLNKEFLNGPWRVRDDFGDIINESNIYKLIKVNTITNGLKYSLATGNWGLKNYVGKVGVAQVLNRLTYNSTLSHLRRLNTPLDNSSKLVKPRKLHGTQWCIVCPAETPEGAPVGKVKNLALSATITCATDRQTVLDYIEYITKHAKEAIHSSWVDGSESPKSHWKKTKVFLNGDWILSTSEPHRFTETIRDARRKGIIHLYTSVAWNPYHKMIWVACDAGRCVRPLYLLDTPESSDRFPTISELRFKPDYGRRLGRGDIMLSDLYLGHSAKKVNACIEYLDVLESDTRMIAMHLGKLQKNNMPGRAIRYKYTHMELSPSLQMGVLASIIPFSDHNQSPRNTYQSAMGKQAMGIYLTSFQQRMDSLAYILCYPQKSIVNSRVIHSLPSNNLPSGLNAIVAIACYSGYNQEDSVIFNQSSVDRGLFTSTFYRTYRDDEKKSQLTGDEEKFCIPSHQTTIGMRGSNYSLLNKHGYVSKDTFVRENDVIIGKVSPIRDDKGTLYYKDNSVTIRNNEHGCVDRVAIARNGDGYRFLKMRVRSHRKPTIGDKHSSRHGQKGTIGMVFRQEDMPCTAEGIVPDLIMNPHAVPSRMTIGQVVECVLGKATTMMGCFGDATPFNQIDVHTIGKMLQKFGFESMGNEVLYNGRTGEQMKVNIFMGPTFYQRLKHMVEDKVHVRATGPDVILTRQPTEGRSRDGGLRFGEMERDCILSHGSAAFLKETLLNRSDMFSTHACTKCGFVAIGNKKDNLYFCKQCGSETDLRRMELPYAMKLLTQEFESMSIAQRFRFVQPGLLQNDT